MSSQEIQIYTIGFTQKSASQFFSLLQNNSVNVLVDTRLKPDSQLSGFAKARDLPYFLAALVHCDYVHMPLLSPTEQLLKNYRDTHDWERYADGFNRLLNERRLIEQLKREWWREHRTCLLCSEHEPDHCHRRLVAEYIARHWSEVQVQHLM
jgi:uncharacterized protein (DUF488 family)